MENGGGILGLTNPLLHLIGIFRIIITKGEEACSMKKEKKVYRFNRYIGSVLHAKKVISFEIKISARLLLDELCFKWNKQNLEAAINESLDNNDQENFIRLSALYKQSIWE